MKAFTQPTFHSGLLPKPTLRIRLTLTFLGLSLFTILAVSTVTSSVAAQALERASGAELHNLAQSKALGAGDLLARELDALQSLGLNRTLHLTMQEANDQYPEDADQITARLTEYNQRWLKAEDNDRLIQSFQNNLASDELHNFQKQFPDNVELFLTDRYGGLLAATHRTWDYNQNDESWWQKARTGGYNNHVVELLNWDESTSIVSVRIATPIYDNDRITLLGILATTYRLSSLNQLATSTTGEQPGLGIKLLMSPNQILSANGEQLEQLSEPDRKQLFITAEKTYTIAPFNGVLRLISEAAITDLTHDPSITALKWRIVVYQNYKEAIAPVTAVQNSIAQLTAGIILLTTLVGIGMAYWITRPITHLTETAHQIIAGDLDAQARIETNDEIGALASTFNTMTTRLRQTMEGLKELLTRIQESAERTRQIVDTVPEGVLLLDTELRVQLCNPIASEYLEILARFSQTQLTHLGPHPIQELLTSPPQGRWHEVQSGRRFFQLIARSLESTPSTHGWVLVIRDVTAEREAQQHIQQQERLAAVGQLAAGIAHDFNNILASIVLYSQLMQTAPNFPPKFREQLKVIVEQSWLASALINQILDFSRNSVLNWQTLDLIPLLKEEVKLWRRTLPEDIRIEFNYTFSQILLTADPPRLQQVFMNLAVNARDAMPEGGVLSLTLENLPLETLKDVPFPEMTLGEWLKITVADTGTGIPPEALPHIFEPFFTTKSPGKGSGLGLAQVYGIITQHHGFIDVQSQPGQGACFIIYLPLDATATPTAAVSLPPDLIKGNGETILVVEDNAVIRAAVIENLTHLNYQTFGAANGKEALKLFSEKKERIDLVLSDMIMPEMGGKALALNLKNQAPRLPIIIMTGHPLDQETEFLNAGNIQGWIPKPPDLNRLAALLAQTLARPEKTKQN